MRTRVRSGLWLGLLLVLCLLPVASAGAATKGVYDTFGTAGALGGSFVSGGSNRVGGTAVNSTGAGGVNPGDVYIVDRGNRRIQRFDAAGNFIAAWGADVVAGGGTEYEICTVAANCKAGLASVAAGGAMNEPQAVAVNQTTGDVYVTERSNSRVEEFSATGTWIRAFGKDVVTSGAEQADETQRLTVDAGAGSYKFTFNAATTADIEWNESAAGVQAKLNALSTIGGAGGSVAVSGGVGAPGGGSPYRIEFGGTLANADLAALVVTAGSTPLSGGGATATIATLNDGAVGFEVCETMANCQAGANGVTGGAFDSVGANQALAGLAVAPAGGPNAGDVLVADGSDNTDRAQEFTANGAFVRAFGWDVVASGPDDDTSAPVNQFEVCRASALDVCKGGTAGAGAGQFQRGPQRIAEDSSGNLYTLESEVNGTFRVQRFTLPGNTLTPQGSLDPTELTGTGTSDRPLDLAVDTSTAAGTPGIVYVLKRALPTAEGRVLEVDPTANGGAGEVQETFAAGAEITAPVGVALNTSSRRLYVSRNGIPAALVIDSVPPLTVDNVQATDLGSSTATLRASITPAPLPHLHTLYRFEYARAGTAGSCGSGAAGWTRTPLLEADIGNGLAPVPVAQQISGLKFEKTYEFCLLAHTQFNGSVANVAGGTFTTEPAAPVAVTGAASWSSPPATGPSLLLGGTVNPGSRATYYFEYVTAEQFADHGFEGAARAPQDPAEAGEGTEAVPVDVSIAGLDPSKTYYYRLLATNVTGSDGLDPADIRSVAPPNAGDRFYELVSPGDGWGSGIGVTAEYVSSDGNRASFIAQAFGQPSSLSGPANTFVSERNPGGWEVHSMSPDAASANPALAVTHLLAPDLGSELWPESSFAQISRGETSFGLVHLDGSREAVLGPLAPVTLSGTFREFKLLGATPNFSHVVFGTRLEGSTALGATFLTGERPLGNGSVVSSNLYEIAPSAGGAAELRIVNRGGPVTPANPLGVIGGRCGAGLGGTLANEPGNETHAISDDGSVVYFTARPGEVAEGACGASGAPKRIFKRVNGESTVEISAQACTTLPCPGSQTGDDTFLWASADGRVAFFTTSRRLVDSDTDSTSDLYVYDADLPAGHQLVQVSAGEVEPGHPTAGSGAKVLGVLDNSADGSRVYFAAEGVLSGPNRESKAPSAGKPNLYVYERDDAHSGGRIVFVATLDPTSREASLAGDPTLWAGLGRRQAYALPGGPGGDGRFLLFTSFAKLTAADRDEAKDVYRYDDQEGALLCLSCAGNGPFDANISPRSLKSVPAAAAQAPPASADGETVAFTTPEAILPDDRNQGQNLTCTEINTNVTGCDVYAWHQGSLSLVSGGTGDLGLAVPAGKIAVSPSGRDIFFVTPAPLVASDTNNANDLYDARVGGGFPVAGTQALCAGNDECQGPPSAAPAATQPGSATFAGPGNPLVPPVTCPKGKVMRHDRCVAKHHRRHQHRKHHRHANTGKKGGGR